MIYGYDERHECVFLEKAGSDCFGKEYQWILFQKRSCQGEIQRAMFFPIFTVEESSCLLSKSRPRRSLPGGPPLAGLGMGRTLTTLLLCWAMPRNVPRTASGVLETPL